MRKIKEMDRRGFSLRIDMVCQIAIKVLQQREQSGGIGSKELTLGHHWITRFLNRHTHLASKFSMQVKKQHIVTSDPKVQKHAFSILGPLIRQVNIKTSNIYNMDKKGLQMGKSARVKVIYVRGRRSPPLMSDSD